jgi:poly-gamma-glutamate capsule biosynthesis protein CapA/YwtB (metallophosphatase superfamily)
MKLALAGDTMLAREVSRAITEAGPEALVADEVVEVAREADLFVLNLECCISNRGERWSDARKPFFFRAPPAAIDVLIRLGVECVTLANNHALDFGPDALLDTFEHLRTAGIAWVGAGSNRERARAPAVLEAGGLRLAVFGCSDHPAEYSAGMETPGIAYADLEHGLDWLPVAIAAAEADAVLVTPHWGPNMATEPTSALRRSARALRAAGAALVAGHSAHVFHAVEQGVLYDLGDFLDDYAVDPRLRNDLGLLFLVDLDGGGPASLEAVPLKLEFCHTRLARGEELAWIGRRFRDTCRKFGTEVVEERERFVVRWRA